MIRYSLAFAVATIVATPAMAALNLGSTACALTDIAPTASACRGWYTNNLNGGSPAMKADSAAALNALLGVNTFTGPTLTWIEDLVSSNTTVNFNAPLFGQTVVSFHVGAAIGEANGVGYQASAFYVFDAGNVVGGLNTFTFNKAGLSNARLYSTGRYTPPPPPPAVPEPATWALMIVGFGAVGGSIRYRRRTNAAQASA